VAVGLGEGEGGVEGEAEALGVGEAAGVPDSRRNTKYTMLRAAVAMSAPMTPAQMRCRCCRRRSSARRAACLAS